MIGHGIQKTRRGFSLTELAIVLLIAGTITGAIWAAAETVWENYRVNRVMQQIAQTTMNIRDYYVNVQSFPVSGDVTAAFDGLSLFPVEMRRKSTASPGQTPIDHAMNNEILQGSAPANGSFHVTIVTCTSATSGCFNTHLYGLTQKSCIKLITALPVADAEIGISSVSGTGGSAPGPFTTAITPNIARGWCNVAGNTNDVGVTYKLHP